MFRFSTALPSPLGFALAALLLAAPPFAGVAVGQDAPFPVIGAKWRALLPPPPPVETPPQAATEMPEEGSLRALALSYREFRRNLSAAAAMQLQEPGQVRALLAHLRIEDENHLIRAWFAHHALAAAETPAYAAGVRSLLETHSETQLRRLLRTEGRFARFRIPGAGAALVRIHGEKQNDKFLLDNVARLLHQTSLAWEGRKWSARESEGHRTLHALAVKLRHLLERARERGVGGGGFIATAHARAYTPADLVLTLAARHILGDSLEEAGKIDHPDAQQCLRWARLNLAQCMVSSHTPAEEAWCAGAHGAAEVSACWRFLLPDER